MVPHLAVGAAMWGASVWLLAEHAPAPDLGRPRASRGARPGTGRTDTVRAYVALTKPRIIELLLVTTVPAMVLAEARASRPSG